MRFRRIARRRRENRPRGCERLTGGRHGQVSAFGMKAVQRGVYSAHRGECGLPGHGRSARTKSMSGAKTAQRGVYSVHRGKCRPWGRGQPTDDRPWISSYVRRESRKVHPPGLRGQANHARITCNMYSVPYKGKSPKKRLSPKSPNTLIHQCITFHTSYIFQYLSLWKSVFSPN